MSSIQRRLPVALLTTVLVGLCAACLDEPPCRRAMDNFYDPVANGYCVLVIEPVGEVQTEGEAVTWCEESEPIVVDCGCEQEYHAMLDCLEHTRYPDCQQCDPALQALQACYTCLAETSSPLVVAFPLVETPDPPDTNGQ
jgi:hypothetical protein